MTFFDPQPGDMLIVGTHQQRAQGEGRPVLVLDRHDASMNVFDELLLFSATPDMFTRSVDSTLWMRTSLLKEMWMQEALVIEKLGESVV